MKSKGTTGNAFLDSYILSLPEPSTLKSPIHWNDEYLDRFPYNAIKQSVQKQRNDWLQCYEQVRDVEAFSDVGIERFYWSMEMVRSRAFSGKI